MFPLPLKPLVAVGALSLVTASGVHDSRAVVPHGTGGESSCIEDVSGGEQVPTWSPLGQQVAFQQSGQGIFVTRVANGFKRRVTSGSNDECPRWSPDATRIVFARLFNITVKAASGAGVASTLTNSDIPSLFPTWSPTGNQIAFERVSPADTLFVINSDGSGERELAPGDAPRWSPDGTTIAYIFDPGQDPSGFPGNPQIYSIRAEGGTGQNLTQDNATNGFPAWSPDGAEIAFVKGDRNSARTIYVMGADGRSPRRVALGTTPVWSPNGTRLAYTRTNGCDMSSIYVVNATGARPHRLTKGPWDVSPVWSPDGKQIAYTHAAIERGCLASPSRIWIMRPDGSHARRLNALTR
jgi:Tol biopolymer transport system component